MRAEAREGPDKGTGDSVFEAQAFDVTLVTPYEPRVIRARASENIWDEAKAAGLNLLAICHQGTMPHLRRPPAGAGRI